jgi:putative DNA primase/helicase
VQLVANVAAFSDARKTSINVSERDPAELTRESIEALERVNDPPKLFVQKGLPVRVDIDEDGQPIIRPVTVSRMRLALGEACTFFKPQKKRRVCVWPTRDLVENVHVSPSLPFPGIRGIIGAPFFNVRGEMVTQRGYDSGSRLYLAIENGLAIPSVPASPTSKQLKESVAMLNNLFDEFPFKGTASKAHTFAMVLLAFVRELISGPTPLHLIGAPTAGTGKTLLAQAGLYPACGRIPASPFGKDATEQRKLITTLVVSGCPAVLLDNLEGLVSSADLCAALTSDIWNDRLLGTNTPVNLPNRAAWVATSNNARLSRDIARRSVSIRLDAETEKPAERVITRNEPLLDYTRGNRGPLIASCLTIVQAWIIAGKKAGTSKLGSFESWSGIIGGILEHAEIEGFLGNTQELAETSDDASEAFRAFILAWLDLHGSKKAVSPTQLLPLALASGTIEPDEKQPSSILGRLLTANRDAVFADHKVTKLKRNNSFQPWALTPIGVGGVGGGGHVGSANANSDTRGNDHTYRGTYTPTQPTQPTPPGRDCEYLDDEESLAEIPF